MFWGETSDVLKFCSASNRRCATESMTIARIAYLSQHLSLIFFIDAF